jgi:hypothetical protein
VVKRWCLRHNILSQLSINYTVFHYEMAARLEPYSISPSTLSESRNAMRLCQPLNHGRWPELGK